MNPSILNLQELANSYEQLQNQLANSQNQISDLQNRLLSTQTFVQNQAEKRFCKGSKSTQT